MQFTRIRLENWRNFSAVDVPLQNRVFVVGANASGKSNFLDVFRFLRDIATPTGGGLQSAVAKRGGVTRLRNLAARQASDIVIDVEIGDDGRTHWRYRLAFNHTGLRRELVIVEEKVWDDEGRVVLSRPDANDAQDDKRLRQTYLEQTFANLPFRAIAEFFAQISYAHIMPQIIREGERRDTLWYSPRYGDDLLEQIAETKEETRTARLQRIEKALRIILPQLSQLQLESDERGTPHLKARYAYGKTQSAWQNERDFSDGTLRLIGMFWALQEGNGVLLLEEPEISLNQGIVRHLPAMMYSVLRQRKVSIRQVILSTHSAELLTDESISAHEVLLLQPSEEGTLIHSAADIARVKAQLDAGFTPAEAILPLTEPQNVVQLTFFDDEP